MTKSNLTKDCEAALWRENTRMGIFGCFEVSIGWEGREIVDFITYKSNNEFRCYEIKVSKADFHSKAKLSFVGDFNYFVMPVALYDELKRETKKEAEKNPFYKGDNDKAFDLRMKGSGIGVYTVDPSGILKCVVNAKRKNVSHGMKSTLLESMVRSLNREVKKFMRLNHIGATLIQI